ncbi:c-type cytochrome [Oceaniglobus indicus]|uniref:c-type cytochrome n=1 Tax=Oceaniglobus indicus TaxID=2047749 RepID=UPI000C175763|nr:cytochrome c [Oceaniglobus indicus]
MTMKRALIAVVGVGLLVALVAVVIAWQPELDKVDAGRVTDADQSEIARGYDLAQLGNCESCHTAADGEPYAGGRAMATPFGTIYSVNITPDSETGIGTWSLEAFARSMREGVDREGGYLYPAFPYTHFTKMSDADIAAVHAYLRSIPAVRHEAPENDLPFPFNIRLLMAGWNLLFLDEGPLDPVDGQGEDWNHGRYLVESVAHCGACHTPRNAVGAEQSDAALAGAEIDGWYAPALAGDGARGWSAPQLATYLTTGFSRAHGAAAGPMGETVGNLSKVPPKDIAAIATYVASLTDDDAGPIAVVDNGVPDDLAPTHALWVGACAGCHEPAAGSGPGDTNPSYGIALSTGYAVHSPRPLNAVRTIVDGVDHYRDMGGPYMPAFGGSLTADQIADVTRYVRARFSDAGAWSDVDDTVQTALGQKREGDGQ